MIKFSVGDVGLSISDSILDCCLLCMCVCVCDCTMWLLVGAQFLDQGLNPGPSSGRAKSWQLDRQGILCCLALSTTVIRRLGGMVKLQSSPDSYCFKPNSIAFFLILQVTWYALRLLLFFVNCQSTFLSVAPTESIWCNRCAVWSKHVCYLCHAGFFLRKMRLLTSVWCAGIGIQNYNGLVQWQYALY